MSGQYRCSGISLVELLVVTVIFALISTLAIPIYWLAQQRSRENRLRETLLMLRKAKENYKNFVLKQMWYKIVQENPNNPQVQEQAFKQAIASASELGYLYPLNPSRFVDPTTSTPVTFTVATDPNNLSDDPRFGVTVVVNRKFLRRIPPHPYKAWIPLADWVYKPVVGPSYYVASSEWLPTYVGIQDIKSKGAGIAIDGSNTDTW